jgi:dipeptidyl aminopeptidase/acylaminoacyl peptidase
MSLFNKSFFQPLDRVAIAFIALLSLVTMLLLFQGSAVAPRVRAFSWQNKRVGVEDTAFYLNFSRPMDAKSVEDNLQIDPPLPGKISWAGRKMAYTLTSPPLYGVSYQVLLNGAKDRFATDTRSIQPFKGVFKSRDRAFAYLGVEGEEQGKLILYNLTGEQKIVLTPKDLVVGDFQPYPTGNKILFSATERSSDRSKGLPSSQLYTVTTGLSPDPSSKNNPPLGRVELVLDSKDYQNLKFALSADGKIIAVQRVSQKNPGEFGLWILRSNDNEDTPPKAQLLPSQPGGDFLITPDSSAVAVAQGQGVAILPLQAQVTKPLDFLPKFGMVLGFSANGTQAAMIRFNSDYTRSLFLVDNQGGQKEILRTKGSINSCLFHPVLANLYCTMTQLIDGETYQEQPYLVAIDLKSGRQTPLIVMPEQRDVQISLSPDGLALLLDQVVTTPDNSSPQANVPRTNDGEAITTSRLWLVPLFAPASVSTTPNRIQAEQLPLPGFHPRWLP